MNYLLRYIDILKISGDKELVKEISLFFETTKSRRCKRPMGLEFYKIKKSSLLISFDDKWAYSYKDEHFHRYKLTDHIKTLMETLLNL